ncbi:hypothetical protein GGI00_001697 [Coemansia sp. RSA 2681]|nr:hypothetical protein GGI00_001697 [Coemansia sp. RSA 2681]
MRKILSQATRVDSAAAAAAAGRRASGASGSISSGVVAHGAIRRPGSASAAGSRRNSASRPATDILSHIQELKDKERHVLSRGARDSGSVAGVAGPASQPPSAAETLSRQERLAREEKLAAHYREQLRAKLCDIRDTAIDLGAQKATMAHFERQLFGSGSPKEAELLELERINGVRSLLGLPPLPQPAAASLSVGMGGVRGSRPGTPIYAAASPTSIPSPHSYSQHAHQHTHKPGAGFQSKHYRTSSFGDSSVVAGGAAGRSHRNAPTPSRDARRHQAEEDDVEQDMDLGLEDGELSEEGELAE